MKLRMLTTLLLCGLVASVARDAWAQSDHDFPNRTVKLIVPYPAGGGADGLARMVAERLSQMWKQAVIVENRSGANGNIGGEYVAKSPPDGYTILFSPSPVYTTAKLLYPDLPFDPDKDLKPVTLAAVTPNVIMVTNKLPIRTLKDLVDAAKKEPGKLTYASQGVGSTAHLTMASLCLRANIQMQHVPYRGAAPAMTDVIAGHVTATVDGLTSALGSITGGSVRSLAVASAKRSPVVPDIPTTAEAGFPGFQSESWYGVTVPAKTPDAIVKIIHDGMAQALNAPAIHKNLTEQGAEVVASTPEELVTYMRADTERWKKVIDRQKIKLE